MERRRQKAKKKKTKRSQYLDFFPDMSRDLVDAIDKDNLMWKGCKSTMLPAEDELVVVPSVAVETVKLALWRDEQIAKVSEIPFFSKLSSITVI